MQKLITLSLISLLFISPILAAVHPYTLAPTDTLEVRIVGQDKLNTKQPIAPDGTVALPFLGRVLADGQTLDSFQSQIEKQFARYIQTPQVIVYLTPRPAYIAYTNTDTKESKTIKAETETEAQATVESLRSNDATVTVSRNGDTISVKKAKPKPIYIILHDVRKNTFETKEAKTITEARALAGNYAGEIHYGDIITVDVGTVPDFFETNWYKIISATAVVVGLVTTLHH